MIDRLVLIGLSGTGKSTIAREVAVRLGWQAVDTDADIEAQAGRSIPAIFATDGEGEFRRLERAILAASLAREQVVIATGGGAVIGEDIWATALLGDPRTLVVHLDADTRTLVDRLERQATHDGAKAARPLLADSDAHTKIDMQRQARDQFYRRADVSLDVGQRSVAPIVRDLAELVTLAGDLPSRVELASTSSPSCIDIGPGVRLQVGAAIREQWPKAQHVWVCIDSHVHAIVGDSAIDALGLNGLNVHVLSIPAGETSKTVAGLSRLWDWLLESGVDRSDVLVAFGGGVIGDLVGFAAATTLRGIGFVQVPTTLLAMVDSSVGGKTGINHAAGKNLIGSFYQPSRVLVDTELLSTLPDREFRSGWAEVIKHGVIEASTPDGEADVLLDILERNARALLAKQSPLLPWVVRRNISLKAAVVEADEREANMRAILNFGHTIGHGIEASGYRLFHGEAVAVGMAAALHIAVQSGRIRAKRAQRIVRLIDAFGLPTKAEVNVDDVRRHMIHDKKKAGGKQLWVLPGEDRILNVVTDVPDELIEQAIASVNLAQGSLEAQSAPLCYSER